MVKHRQLQIYFTCRDGTLSDIDRQQDYDGKIAQVEAALKKDELDLQVAGQEYTAQGIEIASPEEGCRRGAMVHDNKCGKWHIQAIHCT